VRLQHGSFFSRAAPNVPQFRINLSTPPQGCGGGLHIDFLTDNTVRINDDANTRFGTFPRDQAFVVTVTLNINASNPTAHISLTGAGGRATGDADYAIVTPVFISWAQQSGAVKLWMGFPWQGVFDASDIIVT
jgi:hypothetical protein